MLITYSGVLISFKAVGNVLHMLMNTISGNEIKVYYKYDDKTFLMTYTSKMILIT